MLTNAGFLFTSFTMIFTVFEVVSVSSSAVIVTSYSPASVYESFFVLPVIQPEYDIFSSSSSLSLITGFNSTVEPSFTVIVPPISIVGGVFAFLTITNTFSTTLSFPSDAVILTV